MEIGVTDIWATPSTLHLKCVVRGKNQAWLQFAWVSVPLDEIPPDVRRLIAGLRVDPLPGIDADVPLFD